MTISKSGKPVWTERGRQYTLCAVCNRLLYLEHGPVCPECYAPKAAAREAKRQQRRQRKQEEGAA